jgi:hypothetical protein
MATHQYGGRTLAIDAKRIYWATVGPRSSAAQPGSEAPPLETPETTLRSCEKEDCAGTWITYWKHRSSFARAAYAYVPAIAVNSTHVFWTRETESGAANLGRIFFIESCPIEGCGKEGVTLINSSEAPFSLAVDDTHVYWLSADATLLRCPVTGCEQSVPDLLARLETPVGFSHMFSIDATDVFWARTAGDDTARLVALDKEGLGKVRAIAEGVASPQALAVDGDNVYWTEKGSVKTCPRSGCGTNHGILVDRAGYAALLAVQGEQAYWFSSSKVWFLNEQPTTTADLLECSRHGCGSAPSVLVTEGAAPGAIAVDETHVYWRAYGERKSLQELQYFDGAVLRIKRRF